MNAMTRTLDVEQRQQLTFQGERRPVGLVRRIVIWTLDFIDEIKRCDHTFDPNIDFPRDI